jgi:hypothetical protein
VRVFTFLTFATTIVLFCAIGGRLLAAARRTDGTPELTMGIAFLCGGLGSGVRVAAARGLEGSAHGFEIYVVGAALACLAPAVIALGVWRIFRPGEGWAGGLAAAVAALFAVFALTLIGWGAIPDRTTVTWPRVLDTSVAVIGYGWCGVEAWHHHRLSRRQARLGLVEPLIVEQFRLWALGMALLTAVPIATLLAIALFHRTASDVAPIFLAIQAISVAGAGAIYLGFFPTSGYARRVEARYGQSQAT